MSIEPTPEILRIAAAYPPEAALTPREDRERFFTEAQRDAWDLRFIRRDRLRTRIASRSDD